MNPLKSQEYATLPEKVLPFSGVSERRKRPLLAPMRRELPDAARLLGSKIPRVPVSSSESVPPLVFQRTIRSFPGSATARVLPERRRELIPENSVRRGVLRVLPATPVPRTRDAPVYTASPPVPMEYPHVAVVSVPERGKGVIVRNSRVVDVSRGHELAMVLLPTKRSVPS